MCDTVLSIARDHLLPFLKKAVDMIRGVPKEIEELKEELKRIEKDINLADRIADDAEEGTETSNDIKATIKKLIEVSFEIEDAIDDYMIGEEQQLPDPGCAAGATNYVKTMSLRFQIAHKIQDIKSRITEIKKTGGKDHGFLIPSSSDEASSSSSTNTSASSFHKFRDKPRSLKEADVVGFEKPREKLINWLVGGRPDLTVVSIVGMGGLGKTTLAKNVFDDKKVAKHFDCRVWITLPQPYDKEKLLKDILQQVKYPPESLRLMDGKLLVDEVSDYLQGKRYLVVFDDIWDKDFWNDIESDMIDNKNGSKILITTRNKEVASAFKKSCFVEVHELQGLTKEKSLELFNKKAFHDDCPENLIDISSKIVEKCNGLPLAIVVIGGILACNDWKPIDWFKFSENINAELEEYSMIRKVLGLSYHDLPCNLKSCFLYFGLYPEDYKVHSKTLIRQWIAEGFVKEHEGRTLEEVAEGYLKELIRRSLVQVDSISIDGRVKSCGVHDLVHAMIVKKGEDLRFCKNIVEGKELSLTGMIRRLSITPSSKNIMECIENSHVRSLLILEHQTSLESFVRTIPTKYRRLKVLSLSSRLEIALLFQEQLETALLLQEQLETALLEEHQISHLLEKLEIPHDLGSLKDLKFFGFRAVGEIYSELPKSIVMLVNLETLDLRDTDFGNHNMPKEICKLTKLRHLLGLRMRLIELKDGIGGMTSLQTLNSVYLDDGEDENDNRVVELIEELGKLNQLRDLFLDGVRSKYMSVISSSINQMKQLEKLHIRGITFETFIDLSLNSPPPMLQRVKLEGNLKKLPEWISKLQILVKLTVIVTKEGNDAMELLQSMPNLLSLHIGAKSYDYEDRIESLHFQNGWFKNLKELVLDSFEYLSDILIDEGALGYLKKLTLWRIPQLKTLPTGIQHLQKLEVLRLAYMSMELKQSIAPDEGKEHWIFNQVPFVEIEE